MRSTLKLVANYLNVSIGSKNLLQNNLEISDHNTLSQPCWSDRGKQEFGLMRFQPPCHKKATELSLPPTVNYILHVVDKIQALGQQKSIFWHYAKKNAQSIMVSERPVVDEKVASSLKNGCKCQNSSLSIHEFRGENKNESSLTIP